MTDNTRAALEAACARAINDILSDDMGDLGGITSTRVAIDSHVVVIRTKESDDRDLAGAHKRQDLLDHAERARQDTERLLSAEADRAAEMEAQARAEKDRADRAEQMVAELGAIANDVVRTHTFMSGAHVVCRHCGGQAAAGVGKAGVEHTDACLVRRASAALSLTEPVAGRWVPMDEHERVMSVANDCFRLAADRDAAVAELARVPDVDSMVQHARDLANERDAAVTELARVTDDLRGVVKLRDAAIARAREWETTANRLTVACDASEKARDEVGIQFAAAQAEIARLTRGLRDVEGFMLREWRPPAEAVLAMVRDVAAGGPSVPGDALAPRGAPFDEAGTMNPDKTCACPDCVTRRSAGLDVRHGATDTLRARVAELEGLLREARKEVDAGIRARELLDGEGSHIERAKVIKHEITRALEASGIDTSNVKDGEG